MIEKRYEYYGKNGIEWSDWYVYSDDDSDYEQLQKEKWQLKNKLRCEYRRTTAT